MKIWNMENLQFFKNCLDTGWLKVTEDDQVVNTRTGNILCKGKSKQPQIMLIDENKKNWIIGVHVIIWMHHHGLPDPNKKIIQKDGNLRNWKIGNLVMMSEGEYKTQLYGDGTIVARKGQNVHCAKIPDEKVVEYRRRYANNEITYHVVMKECGVSKPTAFLMLTSKTYKHLQSFKKKEKVKKVSLRRFLAYHCFIVLKMRVDDCAKLLKSNKYSVYKFIRNYNRKLYAEHRQKFIEKYQDKPIVLEKLKLIHHAREAA